MSWMGRAIGRLKEVIAALTGKLWRRRELGQAARKAKAAAVERVVPVAKDAIDDFCDAANKRPSRGE